MSRRTRTLRTRLPIGLAVTLAGCASIPVPHLPGVGAGGRDGRETRVCLVDRSEPDGLREAIAWKDPKRGTLYLEVGGERRKVSATRAWGYAAGERWFERKTPIRQYGRAYAPYGPRRTVPVAALTRGADHEGVPVFLDRKDTRRPAALYVPVEPGCVFQPYVAEGTARSR